MTCPGHTVLESHLVSYMRGVSIFRMREVSRCGWFSPPYPHPQPFLAPVGAQAPAEQQVSKRYLSAGRQGTVSALRPQETRRTCPWSEHTGSGIRSYASPRNPCVELAGRVSQSRGPASPVTPRARAAAPPGGRYPAGREHRAWTRSCAGRTLCAPPARGKCRRGPRACGAAL